MEKMVKEKSDVPRYAKPNRLRANRIRQDPAWIQAEFRLISLCLHPDDPCSGPHDVNVRLHDSGKWALCTPIR